MAKNNAEPKKGSILISEPFMLDPNFKRAVVLLCRHNKEEGSLGYVLNKPLDITLNQVMGNFPEFDTEVYFGGPVGTDTLHYIHTYGDLEEAEPITDGLFWGGNFEALNWWAETGKISPDNIRFFVGYSGWESGQLQGEMKLGSWVVSDMKAEYLLNEDWDNLWKTSLEDMGDAKGVIGQIDDGITWS